MQSVEDARAKSWSALRQNTACHKAKSTSRHANERPKIARLDQLSVHRSLAAEIAAWLKLPTKSCLGPWEGDYHRANVVDDIKRLVSPWVRDAVGPAFDGDLRAAQDLGEMLEDYQRTHVARAMYNCRVPSAAFREILLGALTQSHHYDEARRLAGTRRQFVRWCRYAEFKKPPLPDSVVIFRGARDTPPKIATRGLLWTLDFGVASFFAVDRRNTEKWGATPSRYRCSGAFVLEAIVPRDEIVFWDNGRSEQEVFVAQVPKDPKVWDDLNKLAAASSAR